MKNVKRAGLLGKADKIRGLLSEGGRTHKQIAKEVGCSKSNVTYHAKNLGLSKVGYPRYDWNEVQAMLDHLNAVNLVIEHFGMSQATIYAAEKRGDIVFPKTRTNQRKTPLKQLLTNGSKRSSSHLKKRLIEEGILEERCNLCNLGPLWPPEPIDLGNGNILSPAPLSLQLDHMNGEHNDNRIENLQIVCPNCHSQTLSFAGANTKKAKRRFHNIKYGGTPED